MIEIVCIFLLFFTSGHREPKWNKTVNCLLIAGIRAIDVEIYDECTFSTGEYCVAIKSGEIQHLNFHGWEIDV